MHANLYIQMKLFGFCILNCVHQLSCCHYYLVNTPVWFTLMTMILWIKVVGSVAIGFDAHIININCLHSIMPRCAVLNSVPF